MKKTPLGAILLVSAVVMASFIGRYLHLENGVFGAEEVLKLTNSSPLVAIPVFTVVYAVAVFFSLPTLPLNLVAGYLWGGLAGGVVTTVGVTLGGWGAFSLVRWLRGKQGFGGLEGLARFGRLGHRARPWFSIVMEEFCRSDWRFVALARINPVVPTGIFNYLLGFTDISHGRFLMLTFVFLLPPAVAVAYVGETVRAFSVSDPSVKEGLWRIFVTSLAISLLIGLRLWIRGANQRAREKVTDPQKIGAGR